MYTKYIQAVYLSSKQAFCMLCILFLSFCFSENARAQAYFSVNAGNGSTQNVGGMTVNVISNGTTSWNPSNPICGTGPYGSLTGGFKFIFSNPVTSIRTHFYAVNSGDTIQVSLNASPYTVTNSNLSNWTGTCSQSSFNVIAYNGLITATVCGTSGLAQFDVSPAYVIDSVWINETAAYCGGIIYDMTFSTFCHGSVTASANHDTVCTGDTLRLRADTTALTHSATYSWTGPNGFSSTLKNPTINSVSILDSGTYTVTVSDSGGCTYASSLHITINPTPVATGVGNSPVCLGNILQLQVNIIQNGVLYSWAGPNNFSSTSTNPVVNPMIFPDSGTYILTASKNNCSSSYPIHVVVNNAPVVSTSSNSPLCVGGNLHLIAGNSYNGVRYNWTGPNAFSSLQQSPVINNVTATDTGYYFIRTTDSIGCFYTSSIHVAIGGTLSLNSIANGPLCAGATLHLSVGNPLAWATFNWTGPNAFASTSANPVITNVTISDSGIYSVVATDSSNCSSTSNVVVAIHNIPNVSGQSSSPLCAGNNLQLTASSLQPGVSYSWSGPNNYSSVMASPTISNVTTANAGNYILTATNTYNCSNTTNVNVTVNTLPTVTALSNSPVCIGDTLRLTSGNIQPGNTYGWTGPNSFSSSQQNPVISNMIFLDSGIYIVTATNVNGCSKASSVHVVAKPLPVLSLSSNSPVCEGRSLQLNINNNQSGVIYLWAGPQFFVSNMPNPVRNNMVIADTGFYKVQADLNGCRTTDSIHVSISPSPSQPGAVSNSPICAGGDLVLTASCSSIGITYSWSGPNNFNSNSSNPSVSNAQALNTGIYSVVISLNNCRDTLYVPVVINPIIGPPIVNLSVSPGDTVCLGTNLTLTANVTNAANAAYKWFQNGNIISNITGPIFTSGQFGNGDNVYCHVTSNITCQEPDTGMSNVLHLVVLHNLPPIISLTQNPTIFNFGTPVTYSGHIPINDTGLSYAWTVNGIFVPSAVSTTFISNSITPGDKVCFIVYTNMRCTIPDSSIACLPGTTEINNITQQPGEIKVWPNPFTDELYVESEILCKIKASDILGRTVYEGTLSNNKMLIFTNDWGNGIYLLRIYNENNVLIKALQFVKSSKK